MQSLYNEDHIIGKLWNLFSEIFLNETNPTWQHLFHLILSVFALDGFQSVRFNFEHFISEISSFELKSFYYTLNGSRISLADWMKNLIRLALSLLPEDEQSAPVLSVDDTLIEKSGENFEHYGKLYDHAAHNGSNYLNGHCFVSLMLSVPFKAAKRYLSFPVAYRMWTKAQSKLEMAAELVQSAMSVIGKTRQVILCCDSWYPKGCVKDLVNKFSNLVLICNVRSDTALYELPPARTGKRGRPCVRGKRLSLKDFQFKEVPGCGFLIGCRPVKTMLFGSRTVWALVTKSGKGNCRLFLCTKDPKELRFDLSLATEKAAVYANADPDFLPLTIYDLRWNIEVSYYEQKTFWNLGDYRLRSQTGMERLINLLTICYSFVQILPYLSEDFHALRDMSPQEARFKLGRLISQEVFFAAFVERIEKLENFSRFIDRLESLRLTFIKAA